MPVPTAWSPRMCTGSHLVGFGLDWPGIPDPWSCNRPTPPYRRSSTPYAAVTRTSTSSCSHPTHEQPAERVPTARGRGGRARVTDVTAPSLGRTRTPTCPERGRGAARLRPGSRARSWPRRRILDPVARGRARWSTRLARGAARGRLAAAAAVGDGSRLLGRRERPPGPGVVRRGVGGVLVDLSLRPDVRSAPTRARELVRQLMEVVPLSVGQRLPRLGRAAPRPDRRRRADRRRADRRASPTPSPAPPPGSPPTWQRHATDLGDDCRDPGRRPAHRASPTTCQTDAPWMHDCSCCRPTCTELR